MDKDRFGDFDVEDVLGTRLLLIGVAHHGVQFLREVVYLFDNCIEKNCFRT